MNRQTITKEMYIDMDEFVLMRIVSNKYEDKETTKERTAFQVEGLTKSNLSIVLYTDLESGNTNKCVNWIKENWLKKQKKGFLW